MTTAVQNRKTPSRTPDMNYWADMLALSAGMAVFATGVVLLTHFHVAGGALRGSGLALSRLAWVNIHRFGAVTLLVSIAIHVQIHWRTVLIRTRRAWQRLPGAAKTSDLVLYAGFLPVAVTALMAWFVAPGSAPVLGPVVLSHLPPERHFWIDLHNASGVALLPAVILHVRRHLKWILHSTGIGK